MPKYTDPCDHKTILDAYRKEMDEIQKLAPNDIEDISDVKGYIRKLQEEARTKPLWIDDTLATLKDAGTDEASFEMVERLTEELIAKEEKLIAQEKSIDLLTMGQALIKRREIRYKLQKDRYEAMVYEAEGVEAEDQIGNQETWNDAIYDDEHFETLIKEHLTLFDDQKEVLSKMPIGEGQQGWQMELLCDLCSSVWETFHLEVSPMTADECIEEFSIDTEGGLYQEAYQVAKGFGYSDRKAKNYAIREVVGNSEDLGFPFSLYLTAEEQEVLYRYEGVFGEEDYFLVFA